MAEAKPKILKPKSKINVKPSIEPIPTHVPSPSISSTIPTSSSPAHTTLVLVIPISTAPPPSKSTTHAPELPTKNISKMAKVKATSRKSIRKVYEDATQSDSGVQESMIHGESGIGTTDQEPHPASKLDVLASTIDVTPLDTLLPTSKKSPVQKFMVEEHIGDLGKEVDTTGVELVVEGEGCKVPVQKEASDSLNFGWTEDEEDDEGEKEEEVVTSSNEEGKSENEGVSRDEKESDTEDKIGEHANNSAEEEYLSEEEEVSESEGEDQETVGESEKCNEESEEEEGNETEEYEGSMTIGNNVIAHSEKIGEEMRAQEPGSLLAPFTGNEEVSSDEDDVPLSEVGKKLRKTTEKATKTTVSTRKEVIPPARNPLTRSKRKVDGEDESDSALPAKSATLEKWGAKVTKHATSSARDNKGKTKKNIPAAVDRLTEFRNRKVLNRKFLANTDEKGMAQLVIKSKVGGFDMEFDTEELGLLLNIPSLGFDNYLMKKWPAMDNDVDTALWSPVSSPKSLN
nr:histone H3.v1-like [Nicotiana tomentosiformis]